MNENYEEGIAHPGGEYEMPAPTENVFYGQESTSEIRQLVVNLRVKSAYREPCSKIVSGR